MSAHRAVGSASSFSSAASDFSSAARSVISTYGSPPRADASPAVLVMPTRSTFESKSASSFSRSGDSGDAMAPSRGAALGAALGARRGRLFGLVGLVITHTSATRVRAEKERKADEAQVAFVGGN